MPRKRKSVPQRAGETKRQLLSWNMYDNATGDTFVSESTDPTLMKENEQQDGHSIVSEDPHLNHKKADHGQQNEKELQTLVNQTDFYLDISRPTDKKSSSEDSWIGRLGQFNLQLQFDTYDEKLQLDNWLRKSTQCWLYVNSATGKHLLYFEFIENNENSSNQSKKKTFMYLYVRSSISPECLQALKPKAFHVVMSDTKITADVCIQLDVFAAEACLTNLKFSSESTCKGMRLTKMQQSLQTLMAHFFDLIIPNFNTGTHSRKHDPEDLFAVVAQYHQMEGSMSGVVLQHPHLKPHLREYQRAGVAWMLKQERAGIVNETECKDELNHLYKEVEIDGHIFYYNAHGGTLVRTFPSAMKRCPGGILADEMGLGKTVEVLACMLAHPRTDLPHEINNANVKNSVSSSLASKIADCNNPQGSVNVQLKPSEGKVNSIQQNDLISTISATTASPSQCAESKLLEEAKEKLEPDSTRVELLDHCYSQSNSQMNDSLSSRATVNIDTYLQVEPEKSRTITDNGNIHSSLQYVTTANHKCDISISETIKPPINFLQDDTINSAKVDSVDLNILSPSPVLPPVVSSAVSHVQSKTDESLKESTVFEDVSVNQKCYFECICGRKDSVYDNKLRIQCVSCGLWQHPECVNFDMKWTTEKEYLCPHCLVASPPLPSGATLIISPSSICHQWVEEIKKHIQRDSLRVFVYTGVNKKGFVQPYTLAQQDIVITTYETLRKEIDYVDLPHSNSQTGRRLRHPKRFMTVPTPIIAVEWWRICLDEAQMVECTTTKTAEMALRLTAVNRWCVTGTPVQRGIDDLYGLMLFMGVDPFWVRQWWNKLLYEPYCYGHKHPLQEVMCRVMWRTAKKDVLDQIGLPEQTETVHWLQFSPVEEHFYRRHYQECARDALRVLSKWPDSNKMLNTLDRYNLQKLLYPLLRLRQACCHPQAVKGTFLILQKSTVTMEDLLDQLRKKAKLECEDAHRKFVAAKNGLAALHVAKLEYVEAVDKYREVLISVEKHRDRVRTDELQCLHTVHNLHEVLSLKPEGVHPTLRDSQLKDQAMELKSRYLGKAATTVASSLDSWEKAKCACETVEENLGQAENWWMELLQLMTYRNQDVQVIERLKEDLAENTQSGRVTMANKFRDVRGLEYVLSIQLEQLQTSHDELSRDLTKLCCEPSGEVITMTVDCCLRPIGEILKSCPFCKAHDRFQVYESKLFSFVDKGIKDEAQAVDDPMFLVSTRRQGTWADSETEKALKHLIAICRSLLADPNVLEQGNQHLKWFDVLKKEFKCMRQMWLSLRERVSAIDELGMATTRLRLRLPDEEPTDPPLPNIIEPGELEHQRLKLRSDEVIEGNMLQRKLGQLLYLDNLAKAETEMEGGKNPEPCPVCQQQLGTKWSVLQCGHCYCLECIRVLVQRCSFGGTKRTMKCPVCRQSTLLAEISYVCTKASMEKDNGPDVKGDHSTKLAGVVKCLLDINKKDPEAKSLVFSMWTDVLDVLAKALEQNNINFRYLSPGKFQQNLRSFRHDETVKVLLLPIHSGANGLNLVEATHVLLVEPTLNPAQELQAIGRIHRIGQTRQTVVHRFLVKSTIEESIHHLLQTVATPLNSHNPDDTSFTIGHLMNLFSQLPQSDEEEEMMELLGDDGAGMGGTPSSTAVPFISSHLIPAVGDGVTDDMPSTSASGVEHVAEQSRQDQDNASEDGGIMEQRDAALSASTNTSSIPSAGAHMISDDVTSEMSSVIDAMPFTSTSIVSGDISSHSMNTASDAVPSVGSGSISSTNTSTVCDAFPSTCTSMITNVEPSASTNTISDVIPSTDTSRAINAEPSISMNTVSDAIPSTNII